MLIEVGPALMFKYFTNDISNQDNEEPSVTTSRRVSFDCPPVPLAPTPTSTTFQMVQAPQPPMFQMVQAQQHPPPLPNRMSQFVRAPPQQQFQYVQAPQQQQRPASWQSTANAQSQMVFQPQFQLQQFQPDSCTSQDPRRVSFGAPPKWL